MSQQVLPANFAAPQYSIGEQAMQDMQLRQMLDLDQSREITNTTNAVTGFIWNEDDDLLADWGGLANEWDSYERTNVFEEELLEDLALIV